MLGTKSPRFLACLLASACAPHLPANDSTTECACGAQQMDRDVPVEPTTQVDSLSSDRQLGQRFSSSETFMRARYPLYPEDETVTIQRIDGTSMLWVRDRTPRVNGMWHLLEERMDGVYYLLCHPHAEWIEQTPKKSNDPIEFVEVYQPLPATQRTTYEFDAVRGYYVPRVCSVRVTLGSRAQRNDPPLESANDGSLETVDVPLECGRLLLRCD